MPGRPPKASSSTAGRRSMAGWVGGSGGSTPISPSPSPRKGRPPPVLVTEETSPSASDLDDDSSLEVGGLTSNRQKRLRFVSQQFSPHTS